MRMKLLVLLSLLLWISSGPSQLLGQSNILRFTPLAAEYSVQLDRLLMISKKPNQLHIYAAANSQDTVVELATEPLSLSISPDGVHAAVGHDTSISYVDIASGHIDGILSSPIRASSVTLSNTWIHVLPTYYGSIASVNIATGQVVGSDRFYAYGGRYNSAAKAVYGSFDHAQPSDMYRYDTQAGPMSGQRRSTYFAEHRICGSVFFSPDEQLIYTQCGEVLRASSDPAVDMEYVTSFKPFRHLSQSAEKGLLALIAGPPVYPAVNYDDTVVKLYETAYFNQVSQLALPEFRSGSRVAKSHGRWVFFNPDSTALRVIVQADPSEGFADDWSVRTLSLSGSPCNVTLSRTGDEVGADGATGIVTISTQSSCHYVATSDAAWLQVLSGSTGAGNGSLRYIVRANRGTDRTAVIRVQEATFHVQQRGGAALPDIVRLPYNIAGVSYNKTLKSLAVVSENPDELHLFAPEQGVERAVSLALPPLSVAVGADGKFAAVGHDGWLSYVDLSNMAVIRVFKVPLDVASILLASNGYAYLFPNDDFSMFALELNSGNIAEVHTLGHFSMARQSNDGRFLYLGGSRFSKWSIERGVPTLVTDSASEYPCGNIWLSEDGRRLFSQCGSIFKISNDPTDDLQLVGGFGVGPLRWLDDSAASGKAALIPQIQSSDSQGSSVVFLHSGETSEFLGRATIPRFNIDGEAFNGFAQFVFWNNDGTKLIVVQKADTASKAESPYGVAVVPAGLPGQVPYKISGPGGVSLRTVGDSSSLSVGSAVIEKVGSASPAGLAIFSSRANGVLASEATVPAVAPIKEGRIFAELGQSVSTGLALSNPNPVEAHVSFYFTDAEGLDYGAGAFTIPAWGQRSAFLDQSPFNGRNSSIGTFSFKSDVPLGAVALRSLINERSEFLWTTLPVATELSSLDSAVFPTFADGAGWSTQFVLVNTRDFPILGTLVFLPQQGLIVDPPRVTIDGVTASSFSYFLPPRSARKFTTSGTGSDPTIGYVLAVPDRHSWTPAGVAILSERNSSGVTISEAGVGSVTGSSSWLTMYAETSSDSSQIQTAIAITSRDFESTTVTLELKGLNGESTGLKTALTIPAYGQVQMFLNEIPGFKEVPRPFRGLLTISTFRSVLGVVGLRTRQNERSEFLMTTTNPDGGYGPRSDVNLVFPHFADGAGFVTEFILFNNSGLPSQMGAVRFLGPSGQSINLPFR